jgi:hypothetical protein
MALTYFSGVWQDALQITNINYTADYNVGVFVGTFVADPLYLTYGSYNWDVNQWQDFTYNTSCSYDGSTYAAMYGNTYAATYYKDIACNVREISWV